MLQMGTHTTSTASTTIRMMAWLQIVVATVLFVTVKCNVDQEFSDDPAMRISECEEAEKCMGEYRKLQQKIDDSNTQIHAAYTKLYETMKIKVREQRYIKKLKYESRNPCAYVPTSSFDSLLPYQGAFWFGYNYGGVNRTDYHSGTIFEEERKLTDEKYVIVPGDCHATLTKCRPIVDGHLKNITIRKILEENMKNAVSIADIPKLLTKKAKLRSEVETKSADCPHYSSTVGTAVKVCISEYDKKQKSYDKENKEYYLQMTKYYETLGGLTSHKQHFRDMRQLLKSHCAIIPSSNREFATPYVLGYELSYGLHCASFSGYWMANDILPPIPGDIRAKEMEKNCAQKINEAETTIINRKMQAQRMKEINVVMDVDEYAQYESNSWMRVPINNKTKQYPCSFTKSECWRIYDKCYKKYKVMQNRIDDLNEDLKAQYTEKFEREGIEWPLMQRMERMQIKLNRACHTVPLTSLRRVCNRNERYWFLSLNAMSGFPPTHSLGVKFEELPMHIPLNFDCERSLSQCMDLTNKAEKLMEKKTIEVNQFKVLNPNTQKLLEEYEEVEKKYNEIKDLICEDFWNTECGKQLSQCKKDYIKMQDELDEANLELTENFVEAQQRAGVTAELTKLYKSLKYQVEAKCEILPPRIIGNLYPPFVTPYEYDPNYLFEQLPPIYDSDDFDPQNNTACLILLAQCRSNIADARTKINARLSEASKYQQANSLANNDLEMKVIDLRFHLRGILISQLGNACYLPKLIDPAKFCYSTCGY